MVINGGVDRPGLDAEGERHADAVDLEGLDVEAARRIIDAIGLVRLDVDSGHRRQQLVDVVQLEIGDLLAGDDADRLRRLAQGQRDARRGRLSLDRIVVPALGSLAGDDDVVAPGLKIGVGGGRGDGQGGGVGHQSYQHGHERLPLRRSYG